MLIPPSIYLRQLIFCHFKPLNEELASLII
jgi:hypothetical protein